MWLARWTQVSSAIVVCGSGIFFLYGYSPCSGTGVSTAASWSRWLILGASAIGVASGLSWLAAEAAALTGTWTDWQDVLGGTRLGPVLLMRSGLLALAFLAALMHRARKRLWVIVGVLGLISISSFAWTGHGHIGSGGAQRLHLFADVLHLIAAAVWIGALVPLTIIVTRTLPTASTGELERIVRALARFSVIGPAIVALLLLSGLANGWFLVDIHHWRAALHSAYGLTLITKILLFGLMLALAAIHRYETGPALQRSILENARPERTLWVLRTTMVCETALAGLILGAVAMLGALEPPLSGS
jgi:putative copper resistance protein D